VNEFGFYRSKAAFHGRVRLLASISSVILQYNRNKAITSLSDQAVMPAIIDSWVAGASFSAILQLLVERDIRISGNNRHPKVEDAVAICESGLGYEGAMILATIVDLAEEDGGELWSALMLLQRQLKCGLPSLGALGFYEAGFADRVVAQTLAATFPDVVDRQSARNALRSGAVQAQGVIDQFPRFFSSVLDEILT
jgi:hypothetical protein